jgi:acetylornithine deacetylase/succinyl-diaminopimelate desuccinylase-like protein
MEAALDVCRAALALLDCRVGHDERQDVIDSLNDESRKIARMLAEDTREIARYVEPAPITAVELRAQSVTVSPEDQATLVKLAAALDTLTGASVDAAALAALGAGLTP